ncbi:MAG: fibronectin type III domain-containing protein [Archangium sp.]|nr:fibronectin type III domain-containing protein [Archangium sp.]MDP3573107.1 fibronectin type III domain-containing protein [Archangium sp.]
MRTSILLFFVVSVVSSGCGETPASEGLATSERELVASCDQTASWVQGKAYAAGDVVKYTDGKRYIAKFANPGYEPTISTYYWAPFAGYPAWSGQAQYAAGDVVKHSNGNLYRARFANPGYDPTISTYYWEPFRTYPAWSGQSQYAAGDIVRYTDGNLYIAEFANPGYDPTVSTYYWDPLVCSDAAPVQGPVISAVTASNLTQTGVVISWTLNEPGTGKVEYGTTTAYGTTRTPEEVSFNYSGHSQTLSGLMPGTRYHYRVTSQNRAGGTSSSADNTFTTSGAAIAGPAISAVMANNLTQTGAAISWTLNEPGTGRIEYGTTPAYGSVRTPEEVSFTYSAHTQALSGLNPGTRYHYRVISRNRAGGTTASGDNTFTTASATPPPSGNLPAKVVAGYFTTWEARNGVTLRSIVDNTNYNLVYVSFAVGIAASSGTLRLDLPPGAGSASQFKDQIAYANARGKKVVVSVGGYFDLGNSNIGYRLDSTAKVDQFMASMRDFQANWGFNGMDWDLEQGNRPDVAGIVAASQRMRAEFGPTWIINFAPGPELSTWIGPGGVLEQLGPNGWDAIGEQVYDLGLSQAGYQAKIVERMTALTNKYGAAKVLLGNKYRPDSPTTSVSPVSLVSLSTTGQALTQLRNAGINIRGAFVWTIQSDSDQSFAWANTIGADILSRP